MPGFPIDVSMLFFTGFLMSTINLMASKQEQATSHLFVIYGCKAHEDNRMQWQADTWPQRMPPATTLLRMTGDGDGQIDNGGVLRLSVADGYIDLIDKTQALFDWFLAERSEPWLVKCDDDVWLSPAALQAIMRSRSRYAGCYYSDYATDNYAGGPLYALHRDVIARLGRLREFAQAPYFAEDMAVGAAVAAIGARGSSFAFNHVEWFGDDLEALQGAHNWDMAFAFKRQHHQALMQYCEESFVLI